MPRRRYEFRIAGRLSEQARAAFTGLELVAIRRARGTSKVRESELLKARAQA